MEPSGARRLRTQLWHLRNGGFAALTEHNQRRKASYPRVGASSQGRHGKFFPYRRGTSRVGKSGMFRSWPIPSPGETKPRHDVRVGVILDKFSELAFQYEWNQISLDPHSWLEQLGDVQIDLLFVESAWHGNRDAWQYQLTGSKAPSEALKSLVTYCQERGIPTVFWNKEDPVHFEDFIATASLFDYIYTTDENKVVDYEQRLPDRNIGVLPFAAQQSIHNPVRLTGWSPTDQRDIAFAGTYFRHKFPERRDQMDVLLSAAVLAAKKVRGSFDIFARFSEASVNYEYPEKWRRYVRGELTYEQMLTAYRSYHAFLNVNSVVSSASMCARRIFEITACGTPVLSAPSASIDRFFPNGGVLQTSSKGTAYDILRALIRSSELRDRLVAIGQRQIWMNHTYTKRVDQVLKDVGLSDRRSRQPTVSALISTNRPQQLRHVLRSMRAQEGVDLEILVLCHGFDLSAKQEADLEREFGPVKWLAATSDVPLGECYNRLARAASGEVVAKIDDDDLYGPYYLFDSLMAMDYSGADIVGKGAHYLTLKNLDATVLRFPDAEHKYRDFVSGPTIVAKRAVVLENPFPKLWRGEDTGFLRAARDNGCVIYSASRFGFVQVRSSTGHTWTIEDPTILATSDLFSYGNPTEHVLF